MNHPSTGTQSSLSSHLVPEMKIAHTNIVSHLYHIPLDKLRMESLSKGSWTAFHNNTCGFQCLNLGLGSTLATANDGT
jgi:hypothetical protein